jgi:glycerate-2-kinase
MRETLLAAYEAAVSACDPQAAVSGAIVVDDGGITIGHHRFQGASAPDVVVVALGKAAPAMVRGVESVLGPVRGLAVSNHVEPCPVPLILGSHPVPDDRSLMCGERLLAFVHGLAPSDVVVYLISGGGSSIAVAPVPGVDLADLAALNDVLLTAAVPIGDMNEVRAAVSRLKGGGLQDACPADRTATLLISDVVGVGPTHVASGPSIGAGMGSEASEVLKRYGLASRLPSSVVEAVERWAPRAPCRSHPFTVVGSPAVAARAARGYLEASGVDVTIATTDLEGEARVVAVDLVRECLPGSVTIAAGETTVTVTGSGVGGRNQEAALAAAIEIADTGVVFAALGTDGIDGVTPAAGAIVDGETARRAGESGIDLEAALVDNNSHGVLTSLGETVVRGDTGTNVGDLWIVARDGSQSRPVRKSRIAVS